MRWTTLGLAVLATIGCRDADPPRAEEPIPAGMGEHFDPNATGIIRGQIRWRGEPPTVPKFHSLLIDPATLKWQREGHVNPNAPRLTGGGLADALVYLRGVDPSRARPWHHAPVMVEVKDHRMGIVQGQRPWTRYGLVRRGEAITLLSRDPRIHSVRGRGAAYFTRMLPDPEVPTRLTLNKAGVVDLSSGSGYFWMHAALLVLEHPYATRTDAQGRFELPQVPAGEYDLVIQHPNWKIVKQERDPETARVTRVTYAPASERVVPISLAAGECHVHDEAFQESDFERASFGGP